MKYNEIASIPVCFSYLNVKVNSANCPPLHVEEVAKFVAVSSLLNALQSGMH